MAGMQFSDMRLAGGNGGGDGTMAPGLAQIIARLHNGGGGAAGGGAPQPAKPNPVQNLLPSTSQLEQFAPQPYSAFGGVPSITPTYMQAGQVGNTAMPGAMGLYEQQLLQQLMPQFQQNQQNLSSDMASRGIFNSGAATQANNDLLGQETGAVAGPLGQLTQQFAGLYGQGVLQNANNQQGANQYNAGAANTANATNAAAYGSIVGNDQQNYNAFLNSLMQGGMGLSGTLLNGYLGSYGSDPAIGSIYAQGLGGAGAAYDNALQSGAGGAANLANIFGNAGTAFGQGMQQRMTPSNPFAQVGTLSSLGG